MLQDQEPVGRPRCVGQALSSRARSSSDLREGLPEPQRPRDPANVGTISPLQTALTVTTARHLYIVQITVFCARRITLLHEEQRYTNASVSTPTAACRTRLQSRSSSSVPTSDLPRRSCSYPLSTELMALIPVAYALVRRWTAVASWGGTPE